ncbi:BsuPI-related putative proteinase inhibitor [Paenibacillus sp. SC116]|uniref:BsuPI-related putative proteinase inhibitor n=1 Tax=Paenibacillus sp. SC116 TaxID=2968986 RepID=UPI00215A92CC|nr:BsuPI-related putative proteinase inhibitor [Paenibacillus sp. SC116]MCR8845375.1 BsuPI-related putative proteinase inhibitor [Paenibacillus sp. SC116]
MKKKIAIVMLVVFGVLGSSAYAAPLMPEFKMPVRLIHDRFEDNLTRAELATVLTRLFELRSTTTSSSFEDTTAHWAVNNGAIPAVVEAKLMSGVSNNHFKPNDKVTLEQLLVALMKGFKIPLDDKVTLETGSKELLDSSAWAAPYVFTALNKGILTDATSFRTEVKRKDVTKLVRILANTGTDQRAAGVLTTDVQISTDAATGKTNFLFTVRNTGSETLLLEYNTSQRFDLIIRDETGGTVEHLSADQMFMQVLGESSLRPNETMTYDHQAKLERGKSYTVEFWTTAQENNVRIIKRFTVE